MKPDLHFWMLVFACITSVQAGGLPDPAQALQGILATPEVVYAQAERDARRLQAEAVRQGRAEWSVDLEAGQRQVHNENTRFTEWGVTISRPIRRPALAAADRALAEVAEAHAAALLGEVLHTQGRQLLQLWFDWLEAESQMPLWLEQDAIAERQLAAVNARIRVGEAARAERVAAEAARAQVRQQIRMARARAVDSRARLCAAYPGLSLPSLTSLPMPEPPDTTPEAHARAVVAHSAVLARARLEAALQRAEAIQSAKRDGIEPTAGLFARSERGGDEWVMGAKVGLTLPGGARRSDRLAAERLARAAEDSLTVIESRLRAEAMASWHDATHRVAAWQDAEAAARASAEAAQLAERAYVLGEGTFDAMLATRRLARESELAAVVARVQALAARARMQLDARTLWPEAGF